MAVLQPRIIILRRETELDRVRRSHPSLAAARAALDRRGLSLAAVEAAHATLAEALRIVRDAVPPDWRQALILRDDVERFVFGPEDIVIAVGPDGLVANVAKYLTGQPVIGIDPQPGEARGALARWPADEVGRLLAAAGGGALPLQPRVMAEARMDNGETLLALNEIFVGHRSHQSARYTLTVGRASERQSSSGLIVSTGTGLTGWAASILAQRGERHPLAPTDPKLLLLVREAWAGPASGAGLTLAEIARDPVRVSSEMDDGGTIFADGIESDRLSFGWGRIVQIAPAARRLNLVHPDGAVRPAA